MEAEGAAAFRANVERLYDMTERRVRAEVAALPDGEYFGESTIYQDEPGHPSTSRIGRAGGDPGGQHRPSTIRARTPQTPDLYQRLPDLHHRGRP